MTNTNVPAPVARYVAVLKGRVSGDFPGSPIELRFVFTLLAGQIARLEIW